MKKSAFFSIFSVDTDRISPTCLRACAPTAGGHEAGPRCMTASTVLLCALCALSSAAFLHAAGPVEEPARREQEKRFEDFYKEQNRPEFKEQMSKIIFEENQAKNFEYFRDWLAEQNIERQENMRRFVFEAINEKIDLAKPAQQQRYVSITSDIMGGLNENGRKVVFDNLQNRLATKDSEKLAVDTFKEIINKIESAKTKAFKSGTDSDERKIIALSVDVNSRISKTFENTLKEVERESNAEKKQEKLEQCIRIFKELPDFTQKEYESFKPLSDGLVSTLQDTVMNANAENIAARARLIASLYPDVSKKLSPEELNAAKAKIETSRRAINVLLLRRETLAGEGESSKTKLEKLDTALFNDAPKKENRGIVNQFFDLFESAKKGGNTEKVAPALVDAMEKLQYQFDKFDAAHSVELLKETLRFQTTRSKLTPHIISRISETVANEPIENLTSNLMQETLRIFSADSNVALQVLTPIMTRTATEPDKIDNKPNLKKEQLITDMLKAIDGVRDLATMAKAEVQENLANIQISALRMLKTYDITKLPAELNKIQAKTAAAKKSSKTEQAKQLLEVQLDVLGELKPEDLKKLNTQNKLIFVAAWQDPELAAYFDKLPEMRKAALFESKRILFDGFTEEERKGINQEGKTLLLNFYIEILMRDIRQLKNMPGITPEEKSEREFEVDNVLKELNQTFNFNVLQNINNPEKRREIFGTAFSLGGLHEEAGNVFNELSGELQKNLKSQDQTKKDASVAIVLDMIVAAQQEISQLSGKAQEMLTASEFGRIAGLMETDDIAARMGEMKRDSLTAIFNGITGYVDRGFEQNDPSKQKTTIEGSAPVLINFFEKVYNGITPVKKDGKFAANNLFEIMKKIDEKIKKYPANKNELIKLQVDLMERFEYPQYDPRVQAESFNQQLNRQQSIDYGKLLDEDVLKEIRTRHAKKFGK